MKYTAKEALAKTLENPPAYYSGDNVIGYLIGEIDTHVQAAVSRGHFEVLVPLMNAHGNALLAEVVRKVGSYGYEAMFVEGPKFGHFHIIWG